MYHAVNKVALTDAIRRLLSKFKVLRRLLLAREILRKDGFCIEVVLLQHQRAELVVVEVQLDLVVQRTLAG